ncbi:MAG: copper ion binding protein, partial [Thermoleophilaceae bacterium]
MATARIELSIRGMSCASCVARIEKSLSGLAGVREAAVNLATGRASISYDPERVRVEEMARVVREIGYEVPVERLALSIEGMHCASCVAKVERVLHAVPGVVGAAVNLAAGRATVEALPTVSLQDIERAVEALGYTAA